MDEYRFKPIGRVKSMFKDKKGMPIQGALFPESKATLDILHEYREGLKDLEGFTHIIVLYVFNQSEGYKLLNKPFLDEKERGLFSTRAPRRPNNIGFTVVKVEKIKEGQITVAGADMLDETPILDIKPYIPNIDAHPGAGTGWVGDKMDGEMLSDGRFEVQ